MRYLSENLKKLRCMAGLSQEELGRRVGVGRAAINKYEKDAIANVSIQIVEKLAVALDTTPIILLGWDDVTPLAQEVKILNGVKYFYGQNSVELLELFTELDPPAQERLFAFARDLAKLYSISK